MPAGRTKIVYKPGAKYVVHAPNEDYTGLTAGLEFTNGRAVIDPDTYRNRAEAERTPGQTLDMLQEDSPEYAIEEVPQKYHTMPDTSDLRDESGALRTRKSKAAAEKE